MAYDEGNPHGGVTIFVTPFAVTGQGTVASRQLLDFNADWLRSPSQDGANQGVHRREVYDVETTEFLGHPATLARLSFVNTQRIGHVDWRYGVIATPDWVVEVLIASVDARMTAADRSYADEIFGAVLGSLTAPEDD